MASRIELHNELVNILGTRNVYFQPPESLKISYPAIIYSRNGIENVHANNDKYLQRYSYNVIVVDQNPDSNIVDKVSKMRYCRHNSHYVSEGLNHDSFTIIY